MAGLCERCVEREARSPHDLFCDKCEEPMNAHQETHQEGRSNAYWHKFVLDDGTVLRVVFYVDQLYRLRDEWLADGTRQRTYGEAVSVFLTPGGEAADVP